MRKLAAICWVLGMSLRGVRLVLPAFGVRLSHMTVWRDIQEQAKQLGKRRQWHGVRVLGVDGAYVRGWGEKQPVLVAVYLGSGQPIALGHVNEHDPWAVRRFLEPLIKRLGVSVIVTDDLASFRVVAEKLEVEQQVCQFHLRSWVGRSLYELRETVPKQWLWVLDEVSDLLDELPPEGSKRLFEFWKQIPERRVGQSGTRSPLEKLRNLLIRLSEHWPSYRVFDWQKDVPWTNNGTVQAIGHMKMRGRTVRGYKSWQGMHAALMLTGSGISW
jgi:transposase-like protein